MIVAARARKLLFAALAVALILGGGETALRLAGFSYQPIPERIWLGRLKGGIPTAEVVFDRLVPGLFTRDGLLFWKPVAGTPPFNAAGLRSSRELPAVRPAGEFRVLAMGDSCTFLGEPRPWPEVLEERLAGGVSAPVRVLNAGVPAYSSLQGRRFLESRLDELDPDVVTLYFGWNDHWRATVKADADFPVRDARVVTLQSLLSYSRLYQAMNYLLKGRVRPRPGENSGAAGYADAPPFDPRRDLAAAAGGQPLRVPPAQFEGNLRAMVARVRAAGATAVLITAPSTLSSEAIPDYLVAHGFVTRDGEPIQVLHERYVALVRRVAGETGAPLVDAAADFAASPDAGRSLMRQDGIHLTAAGIHRLAELVAQAMTPLQSARESSSSPAASRSR
ncbi:MAG: GDSL-type esterase/lipase family protein [Acidobacteria bacterium]|nr:GDSL-type esterase/lipase family protein [Acidobacteriota bacterium]